MNECGSTGDSDDLAIFFWLRELVPFRGVCFLFGVSETPSEASPIQTVSVRDLVEFVHRKGSLAGTGKFVSYARAREGSEGHREVQRQRGEGYESEVAVSEEWQFDDLSFRVQGRIDGVFQRGESTVLEEIKTIKGGWDGSPREIHWAQAKVYGAILCRLRNLDALTIQLSYLDLDDDHLVEFHEKFSSAELRDFLEQTLAIYSEWAKEQAAWKRERDVSLEKLAFPFGDYRKGQRQLAVRAYRTARDGGILLAEAPTGIGKTMSVLYPTLKSLGEGHVDRAFYLTARTTGRGISEKALEILREKGAKVRSVTLTAKEKICFTPEGQSRCDLRTCPYSLGYYDRIRGALKDLLAKESITRLAVEEVAKEHRVCPFELGLDASSWSDVIIGDFNHAFDPSASIRRFFEDPNEESYALLVDEAHHLPDRAREMYSAELLRSELRNLKKAIGKKLRDVRLALEKSLKLMKELKQVISPASYREGRFESGGGVAEARIDEPDRALLKHLKQFVRASEQWLMTEEEAGFKEDLRALYFKVSQFVRVWDEADHRYAFLVRRVGRDVLFKWYCMDPSKGIQGTLRQCRSTVLFSATLTPVDYFLQLTGCEEDVDPLQLESPFPPENLKVVVSGSVGTSYREREQTLDEVTGLIQSTLQQQPGNALIFFPSFKYMDRVGELLMDCPIEQRLVIQKPGMNDPDREAFLQAFENASDPVAGMAVMGGIFGEGIDLIGERLTTAIIVGVGLPQVCLERDLIRQHFDSLDLDGFAFAYRYPGINRVLQAAGRVIRTETDKGMVQLIDRRYLESQYRELLPKWWRI